MMRTGRNDRGSSEIDVRAAHARVVGPPLREAVDDSSMTGGGRRNVPDTLDAASPSITHVPNSKLPHPLGSPPWTAGRPGEVPTAVRQRTAPASAPKVCTSPDMQPSYDASQYGKMSLGPQTFSFAARQRRWCYNPPQSLLQRWRGDDSMGIPIVTTIATIIALAAYFCFF